MKNKWYEHYWFVITDISNKVTNENLEKTKDVIKFLCLSLPCKKCIKHSDEYLKAHPINCDTKNELLDWLKLFKESTRVRISPNFREGCTSCGKYHFRSGVSHFKKVSSLR
jgi:hypothetical protein